MLQNNYQLIWSPLNRSSGQPHYISPRLTIESHNYQGFPSPHLIYPPSSVSHCQWGFCYLEFRSPPLPHQQAPNVNLPLFFLQFSYNPRRWWSRTTIGYMRGKRRICPLVRGEGCTNAKKPMWFLCIRIGLEEEKMHQLQLSRLGSQDSIDKDQKP